MGLSRSIYYDVPSVPTDDAVLVATMIAICDEFEAYGYRRSRRRAAPSRHSRQFKKIPPSHARELTCNPKRWPFVATTGRRGP